MPPSVLANYVTATTAGTEALSYWRGARGRHLCICGSTDASAIIVSHENFVLMIATLISLREAAGPDIQVILIDSGSKDETSYLMRYVEAQRCSGWMQTSASFGVATQLSSMSRLFVFF